MYKLLSPYFIGKPEPGLNLSTGPFHEQTDMLPPQIESGSIEAINFINNSIKRFVSNTIFKKEKPLVLSGDCLSAIGSLAGIQSAIDRPILLWFDAHGDFHTPQTTISGHLGGMPLAIISGRGNLKLATAVGLKNLSDNQIFLIGGRDLEPGEKQTLDNSGIHRSSRITDISALLPSDAIYWVHYDTDYINPCDAPAMRYPTAGGLRAQDALSDMEYLAKSFNIAGVSISAWAPHIDHLGATAQVCWKVLEPLMN